MIIGITLSLKMWIWFIYERKFTRMMITNINPLSANVVHAPRTVVTPDTVKIMKNVPEFFERG